MDFTYEKICDPAERLLARAASRFLRELRRVGAPIHLPPTFHYITDEQLRSTMWRLAYHSRELHDLMTHEATTSKRAEVLQHLRIMEQATLDLNRTGWPTNHPLVDAKRSNLLRDIKNAQEAVSRDPPSFLLAGTVAGACAYCHPSR